MIIIKKVGNKVGGLANKVFVEIESYRLVVAWITSMSHLLPNIETEYRQNKAVRHKITLALYYMGNLQSLYQQYRPAIFKILCKYPK